MVSLDPRHTKEATQLLLQAQQFYGYEIRIFFVPFQPRFFFVHSDVAFPEQKHVRDAGTRKNGFVSRPLELLDESLAERKVFAIATKR